MGYSTSNHAVICPISFDFVVQWIPSKHSFEKIMEISRNACFLSCNIYILNSVNEAEFVLKFVVLLLNRSYEKTTSYRYVTYSAHRCN